MLKKLMLLTVVSLIALGCNKPSGMVPEGYHIHVITLFLSNECRVLYNP